jgi:hypothetical protein
MSVALSAMHVGLAAQEMDAVGVGEWSWFGIVLKGFSVTVLEVTVTVAGMLVVFSVVWVMREVLFAMRDLYRKASWSKRVR